ncbi:MAG TPA: PAS domain-containing protein [Actinomycetota bacterium]|nr:PAS domain-containing protein [Actinomycetota bacterium]
MSDPQQRHLILILARNFASRLATAVFLVDADGRVIYFNEAAEALLGTKFHEGHGMTAQEYTSFFQATAEDGGELRASETPLGIAALELRPAHGPVRITGADGVTRRIEVTAFPLLAHAGDLVGAVAFFWERDESG